MRLYNIYMPFVQLILDLLILIVLFFQYIKIQYFNIYYENVSIEYILENNYQLLVLSVLSWYLISEKTGLYKITHQFVYRIINKIFYQLFLFSIMVFAVSGFKSSYLFNNNIIVLFIIILSIFIFLVHLLTMFYKNQKISKAIFIDWNNNTKNAIKYFTEIKKIDNYGEFIDYPKEINQYKYDFENIELFIKKNSIQIVFFSFNGKLGRETEDTMIKLSDKNFLIYIIPDSSYDFYNDLTLDYYGTLPIYTFKKNSSLWNKFFKRSFDILFSLIFSILVLSWLIPVFSLIIRLTSKGPIFYTQERIGLNGKPFKIIKLRSMYIDAEHGGPKLSSDLDPRITPIGRILRKYRIDELPQFINVLKGDMSIVGPRPERKYFIDKISKIDPSYIKLHSAKPGITSLGQVYFGYAETIEEMAQRLKYDLLYLHNENFFFDMKIIYLTIIVVIQGRGK